MSFVTHTALYWIWTPTYLPQPKNSWCCEVKPPAKVGYQVCGSWFFERPTAHQITDRPGGPKNPANTPYIKHKVAQHSLANHRLSPDYPLTMLCMLVTDILMFINHHKNIFRMCVNLNFLHCRVAWVSHSAQGPQRPCLELEFPVI